jgi:uncharacterized membrane protein
MFEFFDRYGWVVICLALIYVVGHVVAYFIRSLF